MEELLTIEREEIIGRVNQEAWNKDRRVVTELPKEKPIYDFDGFMTQEDIADEESPDIDAVELDKLYFSIALGKFVHYMSTDPTGTLYVTGQYVPDEYKHNIEELQYYRLLPAKSLYVWSEDGNALIEYKQQATIVYEDVVSEVNHISWKITKQKIVNANEGNISSNATGVIRYEDVLYDVDFITWKVAKMRIVEQEQQFEAQTDATNVKWFRRKYKAAIDHLKDILKPFMSATTETEDTGDNSFLLRFSHLWTGSITSLMTYAHNYTVDYILYEWFRMTLPNESNAYMQSSDAWLKKIIDEAHSEESNSQWLGMQYINAIEQIKDMLNPYINPAKAPVAGEDYVLTFVFPELWAGSITSLESYLKKFIVDFIMYEWFRNIPDVNENVYYDSSEMWKAKAIDEAKSEYQNYSWVITQTDTAVMKIADKIKWCASVSVTDVELMFNLKFSDHWRGNFESLGNYIHRYIVDFILYEWFKITLPSEAPAYLTSAEQWESKIINEARSEDVRNVFFRL